ncbi:MAG: type II toxin-antitoxin system VapC family toxin [Saprospiraceae bacterium]
MKVFIDSSLLVEYEKQTKTDLLDGLLESEHLLFINPIVASEYLYQLLGILGGRSPMAICESKKIAETLESHETASFLSGFQLLPIPDAAIGESIIMMRKHNLLPNDAIILASCKLQNVVILGSHDSDFTFACKAEGIRLISIISDL